MGKKLLGCSELDNLIYREGLLVLFYGEAGSGKTRLLLTLARKLSQRNTRVLFISTEGYLYSAIVSKNPLLYKNVYFTNISDLDSQLGFVLMLYSIIDLFKYIIFDSINSLYRLEAYEEGSLEKFSLMLAVLKYLAHKNKVTVYSSAQVRAREDEGEPLASGMPILEYWHDIILEIKREGNERLINVVKPRGYNEKPYKFIISAEGVEWVEC